MKTTTAQQSTGQKIRISDYKLTRDDAVRSIIKVLSKPDFNQRPGDLAKLRNYYHQYTYACEGMTRLEQESGKKKSLLNKYLRSRFDIETDVLLEAIQESYDTREDMLRHDITVFDSDELAVELVRLDTEAQLIGLLTDDEPDTEGGK